MAKPQNKSWTIFGCGNFIYDIIDNILANKHQVKRIVLNVPLSKQLEIPVKTENLSDFKPTADENYFFGFINPDKKALLKHLSRFDIKFSNLIHPNSYIAHGTKLSEGNFVGAGVIIGPQSSIGSFNYLNRGALLGHNVVVGNYNHFAPGANICGRCEIGDRNLFGASSTAIDGLKIGSDITLGAGSVATTNLKKSLIYVGSPAKPKK